MPALSGPLFSLTARKTLRKTLTYSRWRGIQYVRSHVVPANPDTVAQQAQRQNFRNINLVWDYSATNFRAPWTARATGQPYTDRNLLMQLNIPAIFGQSDMQAFVFSPGAGGAPPPTITLITAGAGQLTVAMSAPTAPTGWSVNTAVAAAIVDFDPTTLQPNVVIKEATDAVAAYAPVITGLPASLCVVGAWLVWNKPDGSLAYSSADLDTATPL